MGSGFSKLKKQAKLAQKQMEAMEEDLKKQEVEAEAGNGLVKITLNGRKEMIKVQIQKECVDPDDIEGLEDLILSAHKKAFDEIEKKAGPKSDPFSAFFPA